LFATFEFYYAKTHYVTIASIAVAALNLGLNAFFIPKFGFLAAGYTPLVCFILCAIAHYCFLRKLTGQFIPGVSLYRLRIVWGLGLGLMAGAALIMLLYETVVIRYSLLLLMGLLVLWKRKWLMDLLAIFKK
jgi:O-antigen/teichoic acid export membrane protein